MENLMKELGVADLASGKFVDSVNVRAINADSALCMRYRELCSVVSYVKYAPGESDFKQKYGDWNYSEYNFNYLPDSLEYPSKTFERNFPVDLGEYTIQLPEDKYKLQMKEGVVLIKERESGDVVLEYPINEFVELNPGYLNDPTELFAFQNDSIMLVVESIDVGFRKINYVSSYGFSLFKKPNF